MGKRTKPGRRLLGLTLDGRPIFEARPSHSLLLAAAGGGKTTCGAIPWLQSMLADCSRAIVVVDSKEGELAAQCIAMCVKHGRKVAVIDDMVVLASDNLYRVSVNPFGGIRAAHERQSGELVFAADGANRALIEEPPNDARNQYWRDEPRAIIEYAQSTLLNRDPRRATPGSVWALVANPDLLLQAARIDVEEGHAALSALARHVIEMHKNAEHFPQHRGAAMRALRIFGAGSPLHVAGVNAEITHRELLAGKYVVFIVGPQRHMERMGPYYALHLQAFMDAILGGNVGATDLILDEFTNAPLKELVARLTTMRGYGGRCHMIAQSRSEIQRKYGERETATIEENAVIKQWFGFSSFEEAERVSRAMGEAHNVSHSLSIASDKQALSGSLQTGKERLFTADELMRLPADEQIIHVKDVGFIHARKVRQNQIAPYCHDLADNPLEGTRLTPSPIIVLPTEMSP
jgi:type IV secretion system protein VirD4